MQCTNDNLRIRSMDHEQPRKQQIQSINNKNLKTILMTPDTTPGIALRTETAMADITQEIDLKQIKYLISQENRGLNNHINKMHARRCA